MKFYINKTYLSAVILLLSVVIFITSYSYAEPKETGRELDRFVAYDDQTIIDTETGLMWAAKCNGGPINWFDAKKYCEDYKGGGYTDWRMPTQAELKKIYVRKVKNAHNFHIAKMFDLSGQFVWASEEKGEKKAAVFLFYNPFGIWKLKNVSDKVRALPVRNPGKK